MSDEIPSYIGLAAQGISADLAAPYVHAGWLFRLRLHGYDGKCRHQDFKNESTARFTDKPSRCKATCRQMTGMKPFDINRLPPKIRAIDDVAEAIQKNNKPMIIPNKFLPPLDARHSHSIVSDAMKRV